MSDPTAPSPSPAVSPAEPAGAPPVRKGWALLGGVVLVAVGLAVYLSTQRNSWGRVHACSACTVAGQEIAHSWVEVPDNDSWAVELEPKLAVVVRGPARFEVAGARPGHRTLALNRGILFLQTNSEGHVVVLMQRSSSPPVAGATVSNKSGKSGAVLWGQPGSNTVKSLAGEVLVSAPGGEKTLKDGEVWQGGAEVAAPAPTAQEQGWLDALTR